MAETPSLARGTWLRPFLILACIGMVLGLLKWAQAVLIPVALAIFFTFLLSPLVSALQRRRLGRIPSTLFVVGVTALVLAGTTWLVAMQVRSLVDTFPRYEQNVKQKIATVRSALQGGMVEKLQIIGKRVTREFKKGGPTDERPSAPHELTHELPAAEEKPQLVEVAESEEPFTLASLWTYSVPLLETIGGIGVSLVLLLFMLIRREDLRDRVIGLIGPGRLAATTRALDDAGERISRYLLVQLLLNASFGVAVAVGLFLLGLPYALLWGFLAAVLRYVPYIGPWGAALLPIGLSLLLSPAWTQPLLVVGLFIVLEFGTNMILEPWLYGRGIGVSQTASLVMVVFWTWLWGPVGLVLATPLTVCLVVLGKYVPFLKFFDTLLGEQPALDTSVTFYQRLLARDEAEAADIVEEYCRAHETENIFDEVLIPALLRAWRDRKQGHLSSEDESFVYQTIRSALEDLALGACGEPGLTARGAAQGDTSLPEATEARALILGCPAHHECEELVVAMFAQLMKPSGYAVDVVGAKTVLPDVAYRLTREPYGAALVVVLPGGLPQARHLCRELRQRSPDLPIVVAYWGRKEDFDKVLLRLRRAGAGYLTTSLLQTRARVTALIDGISADRSEATAGAAT